MAAIAQIVYILKINVEDTMGWIKKQWQKFIDWVLKGFYK